MFALVVRFSIVALTAVILVSAYRTGRALAAVGVSSPEAADILMNYYKVSSIAAFCMLVPLIFLFDAFLKRKEKHGSAVPKDVAKG